MRDTPRTEVYVLDPLPQVVSADWARQLERELNAAKARVAELEARCKRLEEAGDALERDKQILKTILADRGVVGSMGFGSTVKWVQAKEAKP